MEKLTISGSVGIDGNNLSSDIENTQIAINSIKTRIQFPLDINVDGYISDNYETSPTCLAIKYIQRQLLGFRYPDGRIDERGKTLDAINIELLHASLEGQLPAVTPILGITEDNYSDAAHFLSCEIAAIKAVSEVESSGHAFLASGKPTILFEAHKFSQFTNHRFDALHPNVSCKVWDKSLYLGGEGEYSRLTEAMALDRNAALKSASYGRFQIMGFNHKLSGYKSLESFVDDMFRSEENHLKAFTCFIHSNQKLLSAIQQKDWPTFARFYNGPSYSKNHYDKKLEAAYLRHC